METLKVIKTKRDTYLAELKILIENEIAYTQHQNSVFRFINNNMDELETLIYKIKKAR